MATDMGISMTTAPTTNVGAVPIGLPPVVRPSRISFESAGMMLTPAEFDAIDDYDELYDYELINGVLVVSPIPSEGEAGPNEYLGHLLLNYQLHHPQGKSLGGTLQERYVRTHTSTRKPDRLVWAGLGRPANPAKDLPSILVEFVSKSRRDWQRDYVQKRAEYLAIGIKEYWVIDRFRRSMTVFRDLSGTSDIVIDEHGIYQTDLLPGFELPLIDVLNVAERWFKAE